MKQWSRIVTIILIIIILGVALLVGNGALQARRQARAWVYPPRNPVETSPDSAGIEDWEAVTFPASDGLEIGAWFVPPADSSCAQATMILVHGLSGNRGELLPEASALAKQGYGTLLLDLRNHGASEGTITTLGTLEVNDIRGAVEFLKTRPEVDDERIGILGFSLGGATAIMAAARIPDIQVVVSESAYMDLRVDVVPIVRALTGGYPPALHPAAVLWFASQETGTDLNTVQPINDLAQIAPRPILFIHGEQDMVVPPADAEAMYAAASEPKELYIVPGADHENFFKVEPVEYEQRLLTFLDTHLKGCSDSNP